MDDPQGAIGELRATIAAGLPSCGTQRYENAIACEEAERCLRRLEADPASDSGWHRGCE